MVGKQRYAEPSRCSTTNEGQFVRVFAHKFALVVAKSQNAEEGIACFGNETETPDFPGVIMDNPTGKLDVCF